MPRLEDFTLKIKTGERGLGYTPKYQINGFSLEFDSIDGGTGAGETLTVRGEPQSFPHTLLLEGPRDGEAWDIEEIEAEYTVFNEEPYTVRLGAVHLGETDDLNIWYERPPTVIDV